MTARHTRLAALAALLLALILAGGYAADRQGWHARAAAWRFGFTKEVVDGEPHWVSCKGTPRRVILYLHTWGSDLNHLLVQDAARPLLDVPDACVVAPDFNGPSDHPLGCGSDDSLRRIEVVAEHYRREHGGRIDVVAASGGAFHALLLLSDYSGLIRKASLWAPIDDLVLWHGDLRARGNHGFAEDVERCFGHAPWNAHDPEYAGRSPSHRLVSVAPSVSVTINHGMEDRIVPYHHGRAAAERLAALCGPCVTFREFRGGHEWDAGLALSQIAPDPAPPGPPD